MSSVDEEVKEPETSDSSDDGHNLTATPRFRGNRSMSVLKWNLKFCGESKVMSIHTFLQRLPELRVARNISEVELFEQALDLFEGRALLWYRANRSRARNWKELTTLLIRYYEPPDYRSRLLQEIMARTQDSVESIVDYLSCMTAMLERYGNVSEELCLDIIVKNLAPFYVMQLLEVSTLAELEEECLKLEVRKYRAEHHVSPSHRKPTNYVEPDFAFVSSNMPTTEVQASSPRPTASLTYWNCHQIGHSYQRCSRPRNKFCYRCGKSDVTVRSCPVCSMSGNADRRP